MDSTVVALAMLLAVIVSSWLARGLPPLLPLPLIQVGLGSVIGMMATYRVSLMPDLFFLLFLPPLLFVDAWRIPRDALLREGPRVLQLAMGLVFFTVLGMGFAIRWLIPSIPTEVAFALAAVLSPTDAVAVTAIADRCAFPPRLLTILKGEALLNDSSGLVCLRFAISAAAAGSFSIAHAATEFVRLAVGGATVGVASTLVIGWLKGRIARRFGEDPTNQILISLLMPFVAYLMAENWGFSGVLAAVTAGLAMGYIESGGRALALTRVRREVVWDTVQAALNGMIFVLLGEQLPAVVQGATQTATETGHTSRWWLLAYVVAIGTGLHCLRFVWVWASLRLARTGNRTATAGSVATDWRRIAIGTIGGVRGTVTFAGILTLPIALPDGTNLPGRDLAICLAAGVIIFSLLVAHTVLPRLVGAIQSPAEGFSPAQEASARAVAAAAAIRAIERVRLHLTAHGSAGPAVAITAARIAAPYQHRLTGLSEADHPAPDDSGEIERTLRLAALKAEREAILHLATIHAIDRGTQRRLVHEIDLAEAAHQEWAA
jgi:CPA1 family monovalent cation:H+ antiporter